MHAFSATDDSLQGLQIWKAVIALDLVKRRAIRAAERLLPGADLKAVLADPFMMEVRALEP